MSDIDANRTRNTYPEFQDPKPADRTIVLTQTQQLSRKLGIPIPSDGVLVGDWTR